MVQHQRGHFLFIILCAAAVRVVYFFQFQDNPFFGHVPHGWDQEIYFEGGLAFARGDWMAVAPILDNHFSPAYQYFLGFLFLIFGSKLEVVWIAQSLLGIFSTLLVYSIACKFFSRTAGLFAALLFTFYAPNWLYEGSLYRASLIVFLELAAFRLLLAAGKRGNGFLLFSSALTLGLFMQIRTNNLLIFPVAFYYLWMRMDALGKSKWRLAGYVLVVAMVCTPGLLWVKEVRGQWGLYDKSGPENLLLSNTLDHSVRTYEHNETYREVLKTVPLETGPIVKYVLKTFLQHPLDFIGLYLKKTYYYFNNYEIPVTLNFYLFQEFSPILGWGIPFLVIGALGISGALLLWKMKGWTLLHSFFLTTFLMFLPFLVLSRYRLYSVPFLCMFAGFFLAFLQKEFREKNWKAMRYSLICVLGLSLVFKTDPLPEGKIRIDDLANIASIYLNNDRDEDDSLSFKYYRRAYELSQSLKSPLQQPRKIFRLFHDYHLHQARKFLAKDNGEKALKSLERALAFDYGVSVTHYIYAKELLKMGALEGALREALEALILKPGSKETHLLLGIIYSKLPHSPYWMLFHWEEALDQLSGAEHKALSEMIAQVRKQLGLPDQTQSMMALGEKNRIIDLLGPSLSPLLNFSLNEEIPLELDYMPSQKVMDYTIMLYQRQVLFPDTAKGDIHYQLGTLFWKKENRLSAAVHHLEKAWDAGSESSSLYELTNLHIASLGLMVQNE